VGYSVSSADILTTTDEDSFRTFSQGKTRFIYDPAAPEDNNIFLPIPYNKLECPERVLPVKPKEPPPPPPPPEKDDEEDEDGDDEKPAPAAKKDKGEAPPPQSKPAPQRRGRERQPEAQATKPPPEEQPKQKPVLPVVRPSRKPRPMTALCGECRSDETVDEIGQQLALAAAMLTLQMNADLNRPDGKKNGIIGGENPDGINLPAAQIAASAVLMATVAGQSAAFRKALKAAIKKGTPLIVKTLDDLSEAAAKKLATKYGAAIADALNKVGGIGPYRVWRKFTEGYGGQWQAHHILEEDMASASLAL